ncbi:alpha-E domain-containing protein [Acinetobacter sp. S40]|uniref:alpha-E domain-containing protein n=1 Tax=Acinetobacter sp. S40 TaxID=2767434 RepID=UPI00190D665F|nr:alpha-E domain-containing protein [Acinetobacter sp. S40]MBJ9985054.1 alpha-E domain-containing protein [Acinetobacter sp. S40]
MILLSSNAQHIYWLGRYLMRINFFCSRIPFTQDQAAIEFSHAFCLPAYDAASLNELALDPEQPYSLVKQFSSASDNIHELRAVLPAKAYAELNALIRNAGEQSGYICNVVQECNEILEAETNTDILLFFGLGQKIEQLDAILRFKQNPENVLQELDKTVAALKNYGWLALETAWLDLKQQPDLMSFYHFHDQLQFMFEAPV